MIPEALIETQHGMSVITLLTIGFLFKMVYDVKSTVGSYTKSANGVMDAVEECLATVDKRLALLEERDKMYGEDMNQLQKDIRGIYKGLNNLNTHYARLNGSRNRE